MKIFFEVAGPDTKLPESATLEVASLDKDNVEVLGPISLQGDKNIPKMTVPLG